MKTFFLRNPQLRHRGGTLCTNFWYFWVVLNKFILEFIKILKFVSLYGDYIRIHNEGMKTLFFDLNQNVRSQGGNLCKFQRKISNSDLRGTLRIHFRFFEGVKDNFFALYQNKYRILSLNTLVLESIKIYWKSIVYFSMKIKNSHHRGTVCIHFRFFRGCQSYIFSLYIKINTSYLALI